MVWRLSAGSFDAIVMRMMRGKVGYNCATLVLLLAVALFVLFVGRVASQPSSNELLVELDPIEVDPKHPSRNSFGELTLLSGFHLQSKDKRFGGLSGLSIGRNGLMYAISDRGYWLTARMVTNENGALTNLVDWRIAPLLTPANAAVSGRLRDAEALAQTRDGSLLVGFEGVHRIWRYRPPPETFASTPVAISLTPAIARAPGNGGIEGLAMLPDGRLLATASSDKSARLFDATTRKELARVVHNGAVLRVAFSPNGRLLATSSFNGEARLFEAATGNELARFTCDEGGVKVAFSPDGRLLATAESNDALRQKGESRVFEVGTGKELARFPHDGSAGEVRFNRVITPERIGSFPGGGAGDPARVGHYRIFCPSADSASSTPRIAVALRSSSTGLTSTRSRAFSCPESAIISITMCASR